MKNGSCPARGMGVEILLLLINERRSIVMPREGHGSRNGKHEGVIEAVGGHAPRGAWE